MKSADWTVCYSASALHIAKQLIIMHSTFITHHSRTVRLFASAQSWIEGEAVRQLYATAKLDGVCHAVGFPDLHPGKGSPVGAAFVTEGIIYPHLIGGDIGCGMGLFKTDLVRRDAKLDRWARLQFNLEHPWDQFVSDFLAERDLESTEFDSALGTIGGGNHFAELQTVEKVLEADEFKKLGLGNSNSSCSFTAVHVVWVNPSCGLTWISTSATESKRIRLQRANISAATNLHCAGPKPIGNSSRIVSLQRSVQKPNASGTVATTASVVGKPMEKLFGFTEKVQLVPTVTLS